MADNFRHLFGGGRHRGSIANTVKVARVVSVVYGPYLADGVTRDPDYNDVTDIGKIRYVIITSAQTQDATEGANPPARPFSAFMHQYPLNSEYVYILEGPGLGLNEKAGDIGYYYLGPIKLWGSPHHNAHPDMSVYNLYVNNDSVDYEDNQQGVKKNTSVVDMAYPLGQDFPEKANVKSIMPFGGDVILEGRHGNSIRFGSTTNKGAVKFNTWSDTALNDPNQAGKPILILRNGQGNQSDKNGSTPTVENINIDDSSIYMTAGQDIRITELSKFPLTSWNVVLQDKVTVAISLTTPPQANTTLSAQQQDQSTLS